MNIAIVVFNLVIGAIALFADGAHALVEAAARTRRSRADAATALAVPYASVYPLVTARALARAVHLRGRRTASGRARSCRCRSGARRARGIVVALEDAAPEASTVAPGRAGRRRRCRRRSSTSRSGSPTTTARRRRGRSRSSRRSSAEAAQAAGAARRARSRCAGEAEPARAARRAAARRSRGSSTRSTAGGGAYLLYGATGSRQDRGLPPGLRARRSSAGSARSCSCPRSRSRRRPSAACGRASATASRSSTRG